MKIYEFLTSFLSVIGVSKLNAVGSDEISYDLKFDFVVDFSNIVSKML